MTKKRERSFSILSGTLSSHWGWNDTQIPSDGSFEWDSAIGITLAR